MQSTRASHEAAATAAAAANLEYLRTSRRALNNCPSHDTITTRAFDLLTSDLLAKIYEAKAVLATMQNTGTSAANDVNDDEQSVRSNISGASRSTSSSARTCKVGPAAHRLLRNAGTSTVRRTGD